MNWEKYFPLGKMDLSCIKKTLGSFKKYVYSKLPIFYLLPLVQLCLLYMQDAYEFLNGKLRSEKREKNYFFVTSI